jgi:predicted Zn-dependent peptidase
MPITNHHATLPNGLQVIAETDPEAHTAALGFFTNTGARDEDPAIMGVSHFLEHMMFKGTERRTATDVDREFDDIGANHNAFTTSELTAFYAHCLPEHLPAAEDILADIMRPSIRQEDFDSEKRVILEEIAMYRDVPYWELYERAMESYYGSHRLAHRVLGTDDTVGDMPRQAMVEYFTERYSADNIVVAYAGNLDFDDTLTRLEQRCGHWNTSHTQRTYDALSPRPVEFTMTPDNVHHHYLLMLSPAPPIADDRRYAAAIAASILGDTEGSRLYWALLETGLADEAQAAYAGRDGCGEFMCYASCTPEYAAQVEDIVRTETATLPDALTEDDLVRVRSKMATAVTLAGEAPAGRMRRLGQMWTYHGRYRSLEDELAAINTVSLGDLRDLLSEYPMQPLVTGRLSPDGAVS